MLSLPQRLHLIGRSLIFVVGSNHKTVCFPHKGQRKRLLSETGSLINDLS